jgi:hypothetical protein
MPPQAVLYFSEVFFSLIYFFSFASQTKEKK